MVIQLLDLRPVLVNPNAHAFLLHPILARRAPVPVAGESLRVQAPEINGAGSASAARGRRAGGCRPRRPYYFYSYYWKARTSTHIFVNKFTEPGL